MVDRHGEQKISGDPDAYARFEVNSRNCFASFDSSIAVTIHSDAYISSTSDFRDDNNDDDNRRINRLLYPLRVINVTYTVEPLYYGPPN